MKRQKILIITLLLLLILLVAVYFIWIRPVTTATDEAETDPVETEVGESLGTSNRFFLFDSLNRSDISQIEVENEYGTFAFYQNSNGEFKIKGFDGVNYDSSLFATLVNVTSYTLSKTKVGSNLSDDKIAEYGLDKPQARWTVTAKSGDSFTVYVGDRLLTGGGYYCMLEGRRSAYVLGTDVENTILVPIESYVQPVLCVGISQEDYYMVDRFTVYRDGEMLMRIRLKDKEEQNNPNALAETIMDYPTAYYPDANKLYEIIFKFMSLTGDSCYKLGAGQEDFAEVGLDHPAHAITFTYHNTQYEMYFSALTSDGIYYAYSNLYPNVIAVCSADAFSYLEYDLIDWIDSYVFQEYITNLRSFSVTTNTVDAVFALSHGTNEKGDATLRVETDGKALSEDYIYSFRQYYKSLLALTIQDYYTNDEYCTMTQSEMEAYIADPANAYLTLQYETLSEKKEIYRFYQYSTRHSLVTIDGEGEFYVLTDLVKKIENDTVRVLNGEEVVAFDKS